MQLFFLGIRIPLGHLPLYFPDDYFLELVVRCLQQDVGALANSHMSDLFNRIGIIANSSNTRMSLFGSLKGTALFDIFQMEVSVRHTFFSLPKYKAQQFIFNMSNTPG